MDTVNLLVIEDDEIVARTIERSLRGHEFHVTIANSGVEGLKVARRQPTDLVLLDVIMPGMDGYTVCREMRADPLLAEVPILFLTAKAKDEDKISGFLAGADDYLCKPFNVDELILRIRAIIRRTRNRSALVTGESEAPSAAVKPAPAQSTISAVARKEAAPRQQSISIGDFTLNVRSYELTTKTRGKVRLTPVQFDLLYHLMSHPGEIFSPGRLLDEVWDYPSDAGSPDLVRVHIKNLRERIEEDPRSPQFIQTVAGYGYTIRPEETEDGES
ncbi:MAG TPA: response regulator transcription factor [Anaerolineaceae bacterium]|nr:response regulator transcription factor [Anaerolineaceae bacterium]HPN53407.1 response regulator transcription factor [Anaerolineaceae bacterium]